MTLDDLGNIGEFLGSIAVVVSLLYLAVQIRQNTRSVRAAVYQEFSRESSQLAYLLVTDELAGRAFMVGLAAPSDLTPEEAIRCRVILNLYFRNLQNGFYQQRNGLIESDLFDSYVSYALHRVLRQPGARDFWSENSQHFSPSFAEWLNAQLAASPLGSPTSR